MVYADVASALVSHPSSLNDLTPDEINVARASLTASSIWLQTAPNPLWLLQPLLSYLNFKKVPVAFQGLFAVSQMAALSGMPVLLARKELLLLSSAIDILDLHEYDSTDEVDDLTVEPHHGTPGDDDTDL